jgi:hypothetical protein
MDNFIKKRIWTIEEYDGGKAQRHTVMSKVVDPNTGNWWWERPDDRLSADQKLIWDRVMNKLENVGGEDMRCLISPAALMTFCLNPLACGTYMPKKDLDTILGK